MPLLKRKRVFAAKVETTPGTAETLTGAEGVYNAYNVMIQPTVTVEEREAQGAFNRLAGVPGARQGTATFRTDIHYDATTLPTWASVLLPACGFVSDDPAFLPRTAAPGTDVKTLTIGCFQDGTFKSIHGAVGTAQMVFPAGRMAYIDWTFTGIWAAPTDTALIAPTYPTTLPMRFASSTITYNSVAAKVEQVTIDLGNNVVMREDGSTVAGFSTGLITDRNPRISLNPESVLVATNNINGLFLAGTQAAFSLSIPVGSDGTFVVASDNAQVMNQQEGDRNQMVTDEIELACQKDGNVSDQELTITFNPETP